MWGGGVGDGGGGGTARLQMVNRGGVGMDYAVRCKAISIAEHPHRKGVTNTTYYSIVNHMQDCQHGNLFSSKANFMITQWIRKHGYRRPVSRLDSEK